MGEKKEYIINVDLIDKNFKSNKNQEIIEPQNRIPDTPHSRSHCPHN